MHDKGRGAAIHSRYLKALCMVVDESVAGEAVLDFVSISRFGLQNIFLLDLVLVRSCA